MAIIRFLKGAKNEMNYVEFDNLLRHYTGYSDMFKE
jgi:hypothetical protein